MFRYKHIVCVAVPSFAIAVERIRESNLRGRPVVVAQSLASRSRCLAVSSEAHNYGIRNGQLVYQAIRACRNLIVIEPKPDIYRSAQKAITDIVSTFTPLVEPARSGRHFLDLTGTTRLFGNPSVTVSQIQQKIMATMSLQSDAGVASNKLVSRIATINSGLFEVVEVPGGYENDYLTPKKVEVLPAVNHDVRQQLFDLNIRSVEQVRNVSVDQLLSVIGPTAFLLARQSRGIDSSPVNPPTNEPHVRMQKSLEEDSNDSDVIEKAVHDLALDTALTLTTSAGEPARISVTLIYSDNKHVHFTQTLPHRQHNPVELLEIASALLCGQNRRIRVRAVELDIEIRKTPIRQQSFWGSDLTESVSTIFNSRRIVERQRKSEELLGAINLVRTRFGKNAVAWGV